MRAPTTLFPEVGPGGPRARPWARWRADFVESLRQRGLSTATLRLRDRCLSGFEWFCRHLGVTRPEQLSAREYQALVEALPGLHCRVGRPYAPSTQFIVRSTVKLFYAWAVATGRLPTAALHGLQLSEQCRRLSASASDPWEDWQADYLAGLRSRGYTPATMRSQTQWLAVFERVCRTFGVQHPTTLTETHVERFRAHLAARPANLGRPYSLHSQEIALYTARLFLRWAVKTRRLFLDPTGDLCLRRVLTPRPPVLTVDQVVTLLTPQPHESRHDLRDRAVMELLYGTAIRVSEGSALDLDDLQLRDGWLRIRHAKGGTQRLVPVGPQLASVLQQYLAEGRPRFRPRLGERALFLCQQGGRRLSHHAIRVLVHRAGARVGMPALSPHMFRRACATHLLLQGADIEAVQRQLGHRYLDTTDRYVELPPSALQAEHLRTHPRAIDPETATEE